MTKRPLSPEERLIASYMAGQGLYGALQLKNQIVDFPEPEENVIKLKLPKSKLEGIAKKGSDTSTAEKHLKAMNSHIGKMFSIPATIGVGSLSGFHNAAKKYEDNERNYLQGELDKAEQEYLDQLSHTKVSSAETPNVDAFCRGMVAIASSSPEDIEKEASDDMADGSLKRFVGDTLSPITYPYRKAKDLAYGATTTAALSAALATYLLKQKKDKRNEGQTPSRIEIEGV